MPTAREAQRRKYLPKLATGEIIGCFGLTEPDHGSDPGSMVTQAPRRLPAATSSTAPRPGSRTRRSPTSRWCGPSSTASSAALSSSAAPRVSPRPRSKASCHCAPRSPARSCWRTASSRKTICCPTSRASPARSAVSTMRATALPGAPWARPSSAGTRARQYVLDRKQFNRPLAANQLIQKKLADMQTEIALGLARRACGSAACWKRARRRRRRSR